MFPGAVNCGLRLLRSGTGGAGGEQAESVTSGCWVCGRVNAWQFANVMPWWKNRCQGVYIVMLASHFIFSIGAGGLRSAMFVELFPCELQRQGGV